MSTVWTYVDVDCKQQDQVEKNQDDKGNVTQTLVQNWLASCAPGTGGAQSSPDEALTAAITGGNAMPTVGSLITSTTGQQYGVVDARPERTGPSSFKVQITAKVYLSTAITGSSGAKTSVSIRFSGKMSLEDAFFDKDGNPVTNGAGQPFDPPLKEEIWDEEITVRYTTLTDQSATLAAIRGKVNDSAVSFNIQGCSRTYPYRGLKCTAATQDSSVPTGQTGTPVPEYKVEAVFLARTDTWITSVANRGLFTAQLVGGVATGKIIPALDANNAPVTTPVYLTLTGQQTATPTIKSFKMEDEASYTTAFTGLA